MAHTHSKTRHGDLASLLPFVRAGIVLFFLAVTTMQPASTFAADTAPGWSIHSTANPTRFSSADNANCLSTLNATGKECDYYLVTVTNSGAAATTEGAAITLEDAAPAGTTVQLVELLSGPWSADVGFNEPLLNLFPEFEKLGVCTKSPIRCSVPLPLPPDAVVRLKVYVTVNEGAGSLTNSASVSGGGAAPASVEADNPLGGASPPFGIARASSLVASADGTPDSRAGDHPYELTTRIDLNSEMRITSKGNAVAPDTVEDPKDIVVDLPLGFLGSALATPTCTFAQLSSHVDGGVSGCPSDTVVGHLQTDPQGTDIGATVTNGPIYNMMPERGTAAEFGFIDGLAGPHVLYASVAPTPNGYVLRATASDVPQVPLTDIVATFFGDPSAKDASGTTPVAEFTNPSSCSGEPLSTTVYMDSWQHPGARNPDGSPDLGGEGWVSATAPSFPEGLTGCDLLQFAPTMTAQPETATPGAADSPAGLNFSLKLPQFEEPGTSATPPLRDAVVKLPEGLSVNPSSAGGLEACSEAQIGFLGFNEATKTEEFAGAAPSCPDASKVGTVELTTPLLATTLKGSVFLASQRANPFGSILAGYIVVDDPRTGVVVKIAGELKADEHSGQITGVFKNNPQFPFSELKLHFKGGSRGVLATPESCGTYTTTSELSPWSAPDSGPPATPSSSFQTTTGCVDGFAPSFNAGTTSTRAGAYSPFVMSFERGDSEQEPSGLKVVLPPGLLANVAGVARCSDAQIAAAAAGTGQAELASPSCPHASQVGTVRAGAGPGPTPFFVSGKAYLTGPYKGAPYGLAVVVPAVAGPFDLGNVVVRAALQVDPADGHVTAISDPLPTMIDSSGIPAHLRRVDVIVDRPEFTFNPTSCAPMSIAGAITGGLPDGPQGATAAVSSRFQVADCASLDFKPGFKASTSAKTSRANGASLKVKLTYPKAPFGSQANIKSVHVELPKALPSRLSTLNHACRDSVFDRDPAGCPAQSRVGYAKAVTPVLSVPLEGPAYFVSHGGQKFPELIVVLQGEGITIDLAGETFISKAGITSSTFKSVPDVPVSSFELTLPEGPFSALAANRDLCTTSLAMPTTFTGQNGAVFKQRTKIAVTGCRPAIHVVGHSVKGSHASIRVSVPSAGTLVATGGGIERSVKRAAKAGTVTIGVALTSQRLRVLAKNPHQRVNAKVRLRFKPRHGAALTASVRLLMG